MYREARSVRVRGRKGEVKWGFGGMKMTGMEAERKGDKGGREEK